MSDMGTCGFCGFGGGYLLDQGDESSQILHSAVRTGDSPDNWQYTPHPNAWDNDKQQITWCGHCIGGLKHKYQRYDDTNLHALHISYMVRLELDGIRWSNWSENKVGKNPINHKDDPAIHLDKLHIERALEDIQNEEFRRAGFDLTTRNWRE